MYIMIKAIVQKAVKRRGVWTQKKKYVHSVKRIMKLITRM